MPNRRQFLAAGATAGLAAMPSHAATTPLPTGSLADLQRSVQAVVASKRIGQPVFIRLTWQTGEVSLDRAGELVELVRQWTGQAVDKLHAVGSLAGGQLCLSVQFANGATALVSLAKTPPRGDGVDLLLIGNHGSVMYDSGTAMLWDGAAVPTDLRPDAKLRQQIEQAVNDAARKR
jgi:hypothetical protein